MRFFDLLLYKGREVAAEQQTTASFLHMLPYAPLTVDQKFLSE